MLLRDFINTLILQLKKGGNVTVLEAVKLNSFAISRNPAAEHC